MKAEVAGANVVVLGSFNPKIFQPAWFAANGLISKLETEDEDTEIVHTDVSICHIGDWLRVEVTKDRFHASTEQEAYFGALIDFVLGTFTLLPHTPAGILGINTSMHYKIGSTEAWRGIGDELAPKKRWQKFMKTPGMTRVEMRDERTKGPVGYLKVGLEPSIRVHPGVYVNTNDHYETDDPQSAIGCSELMGILDNNWKNSICRAYDIAEALLG